MGFGSPDQPGDVEPFITNLTGCKPSPEFLQRVLRKYRAIGGRSPFMELAQAQARALGENLKQSRMAIKVFLGMCYGHPLISKVLEQMADGGIKKIVAINLSPYASSVSSAYEQQAREALERIPVLQAAFTPPWYAHPLYLAAWEERIWETLACYPPEIRPEVKVIFSAHSLPREQLREFPYAKQVEATAEALSRCLPDHDWTLGYQSQGERKGAWLGPRVEEILEKAAEEGKKDVLIVPVGFVTDHVETLYDLDHQCRKYAEALGLGYRRAKTLNTSPRLIQALGEIACAGFLRWDPD